MDRFHESPIDAEQAERHSSEALASTSNVEIEAPSRLTEIRDELVRMLKNEQPAWNATAIDDELIGIEYGDEPHFIEVQNV